jgi:hypothetical protein
MSPEDIDSIEDDEFYLIVRANVLVLGKDLKSPKFQSFISDVGGEVEKASDADARRYYPQKDEWEVYQRGLSPPVFIIRPSFNGVRKLAAELDLPTDDGDVYYSRFYEGGDYVEPRKRPIAQYQKYSVETFGLCIKASLPLSYPVKYEPPHPSQYATLPKYWWESERELIQIWRLRIFSRPLESFKPTPSNPLSSRLPDFPYLEERWHPKEGRYVLLGGLQNYDRSFASDLQRFFSDAYCILEKKKKMGRPTGTGEYPTQFNFYRIAIKKYCELWKPNEDKPTKGQVALKMKISESTFKRHWRTTGLKWPPIIEPPE